MNTNNHDVVRRSFFWLVALRRGFKIVVGLLVSILFYTTVFGLPEWVVDRVLTRINEGDITVQCGTVRFVPLRHFSLRDVRIFRKRSIGPPMIEAETLKITLNPFVDGPRSRMLRRVSIHKGIIRPEMFASPTGLISRVTVPVLPPVFKIDADVQGVVIQGVTLRRADAVVYSDGWNVVITNIDGSIGSLWRRESLGGSVSYSMTNRELNVAIVSDCDPNALVPMIDANGLFTLSRLVKNFQFPKQERPHVVAQMHTWVRPHNPFYLAADFSMPACVFRGVSVQSATGRVDVMIENEHNTLRLAPLVVSREEGTASGRITVHIAPESLVEFDARSSVEPKAMLQMLGLLTNGALPECHFEGPFDFWGRGVVDYGNFHGTDFRGGGNFYGFRYRDYPVITNNCFFMKMEGLTNICPFVEGRFYGGLLRAQVDVRATDFAAQDWRYAVTGKLDQADFGSLAADRKITNRLAYCGALSGSVFVQGMVKDSNGATMTGNGRVSVRNGRVFLLPVFGGLSTLMARIIPGVDFVLRQTDMKADFAISNRMFSTENAVIEGSVLSLSGRGNYTFDQNVNFDVQVRLMKEKTFMAKVLRVVTYPLSKLFELRLRGTRDAPRWYPVNFSADVFGKMGWRNHDKASGVSGANSASGSGEAE